MKRPEQDSKCVIAPGIKKMTVIEYNTIQHLVEGEMNTTRVLIAGKSRELYLLRAHLQERGLFCTVDSINGNIFRQITEQKPDIILFEIDPEIPNSRELIRDIKREKSLPVIVLIRNGDPQNEEICREVDDFAIEPFNQTELVIRIKRLLKNPASELFNHTALIEAGDLVIDQAKCEVSVGGRIVILAYKEYELLKFLVNNRGRVFSRQALLDKVWGYDYFGGDRTVDVHIRRLRAKIEDSSHSFIDTVRSIGYRFKDDV